MCIPVHAGHQFRSMPSHDSGPCRATIPVDAGRGVTWVNRRYRGLFRWEGELRWGKLPVRKIREVLRLKAEGFGDRRIAAAIGSARSTVQECARRARDAGVTWPLPPAIDEAALHAMLYKRVVPLSRTPRPDFACLHAELRRRGITRLLLWEEYKSAHPDGWQYSVFSEQYRRWTQAQELVIDRCAVFADHTLLPALLVAVRIVPVRGVRIIVRTHS
jgi:hypothetical protein